ncbi:flagellar biosynthesis repressor FlbT [Caulobacter segnis]
MQQKRLSLKPGEEFVLNGRGPERRPARCSPVLQNKASVLREKDIMQPDQVTTPARAGSFPVMMMYLKAWPRSSTARNSRDAP